MIQCPYCERSLGSEGSYRVHKHRFHNGLEYRRPTATHEEVQQTVQEPVEAEHEPFVHETLESEPQEQPEPQEPEHHGRSVVERGKGGDGDGLAIIGGLGAIAVVIILALLGKKQ